MLKMWTEFKILAAWSACTVILFTVGDYIDERAGAVVPTPSKAPSVVSTTPSAGASEISFSFRNITATFDETVKAKSIKFVFSDSGGNPVAASFGYDDLTKTASLVPNAALAASTTYTATVSGAQKMTGAAMTSPFSWSFTTAASSGPPTVTGTTPGAEASGISRSAPHISARFNESVQRETISFVLKDFSGKTIRAAVTYDDSTNAAAFTPDTALAASTTYIATVSEAKNRTGEAMTSPFSWSFTTAVLPRTTDQSLILVFLNKDLGNRQRARYLHEELAWVKEEAERGRMMAQGIYLIDRNGDRSTWPGTPEELTSLAREPSRAFEPNDNPGRDFDLGQQFNLGIEAVKHLAGARSEGHVVLIWPYEGDLKDAGKFKVLRTEAGPLAWSNYYFYWLGGREPKPPKEGGWNKWFNPADRSLAKWVTLDDDRKGTLADSLKFIVAGQ
jgi:Bacterial Ig-like domain